MNEKSLMTKAADNIRILAASMVLLCIYIIMYAYIIYI